MKQEENNYSWWTCKIAKELTCRWYSQGGTDYTCLQPGMVNKYNRLLKEMGEDLDKLHEIGFKILSREQD